MDPRRLQEVAAGIRPRQKQGDPMSFEFLHIFGAGPHVRATIPWLEERGLEWKLNPDMEWCFQVTFADPEDAMLFKLTFC